ncbi:MAG TPA: sigma 54-interacting transcriptional regulator [Terriglobales bacterium]|nr:sigma 54-interacting transcriptional regulator [Terriglobales bacterium]
MQQVPERHLDSATQLCFDELSSRYKVLLHAIEVAASRGFPDLLQELTQLLRELFDFNFLNYAIRDDQADLMRVHMVDEELRAPEAIGSSSNESCAEWVWSKQEPLVISDAQTDSRFGAVLDLYASRKFHSLVILPMSTAGRRLGTLCLGSAKATHYDDEVLYFLERLASLVGLALETALSTDFSVIKQALVSEEDHVRGIATLRMELSERSAAAHEALRREQEQLETILQLQGALAASRTNLHQMFPAITAPLQTGDRPAGTMYFVGSATNTAEPVRSAGEAGIPVENRYQAAKLDKERLHTLLEISRTLTFAQDSTKVLQDVSACVRRLTAQDCTYLALYDASTESMRIQALDFPGGRGLMTVQSAPRVSECPTGVVFQAVQARMFSAQDLEEFGSEFTKKMLAEGLRWVCCLPLVGGRGPLGTLSIAGKKDGGFGQAEMELLEEIAAQIGITVDNFNVREEISDLKGKIAKQAIAVQRNIHGAIDLQAIVGKSHALANVLQQVKTVAPSAATVLILGETGTGKELVAHAIHKLSPRSGGNFVKLNCAAIPTGLLESELFGHEKGAFTGAISQKIGRLELAHKGTLFLDEVGEIPLELQPKLLRVLQDQEFERLGGTRTIRVDVRILAATNREISKAVASHEFRSDLYYRLHVFPIRLPALRQRAEDIPMLVHYFVQKFALRMNKQIESIPAETMEVLCRWHWPGNIRELENFMERSVILTDGPSLRVPVDELGSMVEDRVSETQAGPGSVGSQGTLEELERQYIVQVLRQSAGVVSGSQGAAARLGMKRTTLQSKMQRLRITRDEYAS